MQLLLLSKEVWSEFSTTMITQHQHASFQTSSNLIDCNLWMTRILFDIVSRQSKMLLTGVVKNVFRLEKQFELLQEAHGSLSICLLLHLSRWVQLTNCLEAFWVLSQGPLNIKQKQNHHSNKTHQMMKRQSNSNYKTSSPSRPSHAFPHSLLYSSSN